MSGEISVSVVVPVYNGAGFIERCIDSILPQLPASGELIVVDDGSEDDSFSRLREAYSGEDRLVLVRENVNAGPAAARNTGIRLARGNYIAFSDADDEWGENHLAGAIAFLEENPDMQAVFTAGAAVLDDRTARTEQLAARAAADRIHFRTMVCRREVFDMAGLMDESLRLREDTEWIVRARKAGVRAGWLSEESYVRHIRSGGLSALADEDGRGDRMIGAMLRGLRGGRALTGPVCDISILIPMYNAEKYIAEAVGSCSGSAGPERYTAEIVIVDDGSSDGSVRAALALLDKLAGESMPAKLVARKHKGQAFSRNDALHLARGRYILYLDADDYFLPGAVDIMADAAMADTIIADAAADGASTASEAADGASAGSETAAGSSAEPLVSALCRDFISPELTKEEASSLVINPEPYRRMLSGCMFASRALYDIIGEFNENMPTSETAEWVMRMRDAGIRVLETDDIVLARRYHKTNLGRTSRKAQMESYLSLVRGRLKARQARKEDTGAPDGNS